MLRIRGFVALIALTGAALFLPVAANAQCVPAAFPPGWLNAQEAAGGHTIARHVNQTLQAMITRIFNAGLPVVSTYPTVAGAQATITAALAANAAAINAWRAAGGVGGGPVNVGTTRAFDYTSAANVGTVVQTVGNPPDAITWGPSCAFRVVLRATGGNTCLLLTSYPTPAVPNDHCP